MMNRPLLKSSRARLWALLGMASVVVQGVSGCGRAESLQADSETHWLVTCDSDLDCDAGSCECGVCTEVCITSADCSALDVAGVECVPTSGASCESSGASAAGSASSDGAACLLPCTEAADCAGLGAGAVCESQRCERPSRALIDDVAGGSGSGGSGSGSGSGSGGVSAVAGNGGEGNGNGGNGAGSSASALCDGSEDVRFAWVIRRGFPSSYYPFTESRGSGFLAIDGQCRFWRAAEPNGSVSTGALRREDAQAFASTLGYERVLAAGTYEDVPGCSDGDTSMIWTPDSRITCSCDCGARTNAPPGWAVAFRTMSDARLDDWFGNAEPMTGPARIALLGFDDPPFRPNPLVWPLSRAPRDNEHVFATQPLDEASGAELTNPDELSRLRAARATYLAREPGSDFTLLIHLLPSTTTAPLEMLLRDELPAPIQEALRAASGVP